MIILKRLLQRELNQGYAKSIVDKANMIIKSAEYQGKNPLKSKIKKLFVESKGRASFRGNQNLKLLSTAKLLISYNFGGKHGRHKNRIKCDVRFG